MICELCKQQFQTQYKLKNHIKREHHITWDDYIIKTVYNGVLPQCKCGCGQNVRIGNVYIHGHNCRDITLSDETRQKIGKKNSEKLKKYYAKNRNVAQLKAARMREFITNETIEKRNATIRSTNTTEEYREKMSDVVKEMWHTHPNELQQAEIHRRETNLRRYGVENCLEKREKIKQTNISKFGCENPQQNIEIQKRTMETCLKKYGVKYAMLKSNSRSYSKIEYHIVTMLKTIYGNENVITQHTINKRWRLDAIITTHNVHVEVDGIYWHYLKYSNQNLIEMESIDGLQRRLRDLEENEWFQTQENMKLLRIDEITAHKISLEKLKMLVENCNNVSMTYEYVI